MKPGASPDEKKHRKTIPVYPSTSNGLKPREILPNETSRNSMKRMNQINTEDSNMEAKLKDEGASWNAMDIHQSTKPD